MQNILTILVALLLTSSLDRATPQKDEYYPAEWQAFESKKLDDSFFIAVTITQRAVIHSTGETSEQVYIIYFHDHVFQDGDLCISSKNRPSTCIALSFMLSSKDPELQKLGRIAKKTFVQMYKEEIRSAAEQQLQKQRNPAENKNQLLLKAEVLALGSRIRDPFFLLK